MLKEYITHKRAKQLMKRIKKIDICNDTKLVETEHNKNLVIKISKFFFEPEKFAELIKLLMEECVKYNLYFHGFLYEQELTIKVNYR